MTHVPSSPRAKRPVRSMRRSELVAEANRLGIKNTERYNVDELRLAVSGRMSKEAGR